MTMSTIHREQAEKLLNKVRIIINSNILHSDLARDLIETELAITYIDGQQKQLEDCMKELKDES